MSRIKTYLASAPLVAAFIMAASVAFLAAALTAEHVFGLAPCILCIYQRWPYVATAFLGLVALFFALKGGQTGKAAFFIFIAGLVFLGEAGLAFYHVGVEQRWWVSAFEGCKVSFDGSAEDMLAAIQNRQAVRCDEIPWQMFGISMAGYNVVTALGMALISLLSSVLIIRKKNGVL